MRCTSFALRTPLEGAVWVHSQYRPSRTFELHCLLNMNPHHPYDQSPLFALHDEMQHCVVLKKVGQCTVYELYDEESNAFLLACVTCTLLSPMLLFVTTPDCHQRKFEDICCNLNIRYFVAKMLPDWMTGLNFKLTGFDESLLCDIK